LLTICCSLEIEESPLLDYENNVHEVQNTPKRTAVTSWCAPDSKHLKQHRRDFAHRFKNAKFQRKPPFNPDLLLIFAYVCAHTKKMVGGYILSEARNTLDSGDE
jgi:hypothetical protein